MTLQLNGKKANSLDHFKVLRDLHDGLTYEEVAILHSAPEQTISKNTVWRIASFYDRLKHKRKSLSHLSEAGLRRIGWACARPMGQYTGKYPGGFLNRVDELLRIKEDTKVLHLFSGSLKQRPNEDTMDIQPENNPTILADARKEFPIDDDIYDVIISDPPYDMTTTEGVIIDYSSRLWKTERVKPYSWVEEAVRILKPGGLLLVLHHLVYKTPTDAERKLTVSVTCGPNTRIRCLSIFRKHCDVMDRLELEDEIIQDQIFDLLDLDESKVVSGVWEAFDETT